MWDAYGFSRNVVNSIGFLGRSKPAAAVWSNKRQDVEAQHNNNRKKKNCPTAPRPTVQARIFHLRKCKIWTGEMNKKKKNPLKDSQDKPPQLVWVASSLSPFFFWRKKREEDLFLTKPAHEDKMNYTLPFNFLLVLFYEWFHTKGIAKKEDPRCQTIFFHKKSHLFWLVPSSFLLLLWRRLYITIYSGDKLTNLLRSQK